MNAIVESIIKPAIRRLGTAGATYLLSVGLPSELVEPLVNHLAAIVLVVLDLVLARYYRKGLVNTAVAARVAQIINDVRSFGDASDREEDAAAYEPSRFGPVVGANKRGL